MPGKEADFIVLDLEATPLIARRMQRTQTLAERLFVLMTLGDDRAIAATHVLGDAVHTRTLARSGPASRSGQNQREQNY